MFPPLITTKVILGLNSIINIILDMLEINSKAQVSKIIELIINMFIFLT